MRLMGALGVLGTLLACLCPSPAVAVQPTAACGPRGAHTLLADRQARVFTFHARPLPEYLQVGGCVPGHRRLDFEGVEMAGENSGPCANGCVRHDWRETFALAGTMFAYAADSEPSRKYGDCYCDQWHVIVQNLRTGRFVHRVLTGPHRGSSAFDYYAGVGPAGRVVAKADGAVAWVVPNLIPSLVRPLGQAPPPISYEVRALDGSGERLLATGADIDPSSLTLRGATLTWTEGGELASARLP
jgi:hypothetical protein